MSKSLSYYFKKTIGYLKHALSIVKFDVADIMTRLKKRNPDFEVFPKEINENKQGRHIFNHDNYVAGRSIISLSIKEIQSLIYTYSGKGKPINSNKERVDFNRVIGTYIDKDTKTSAKTTIGIIHYSKTGTHVVPAQPRK